MRILPRALFAVLLVCVSSCVVTPPVSGPGYQPPRVLMPLDLTVREQAYAPQVEDALRRAGYDPVFRGSADMLLEFTIEEGPVNVVTFIRLSDHGRLVALGEGRASGPPLLNRNRVLEDSFYQALRQFESRLGGRPAPYPVFR